jgi:replication-associated recombination protein RarA
MSALYDKYRPATLEQVAGQDRLKKRLLLVKERFGWLGQVFLFAGPSGSGKTTISRIIAAEVADDFSTFEVDAQDVALETLRDWESRCQMRPLGGKGYAFVINEFHNASSRVVSKMQTLLEEPRVMKNSTWLLTTTHIGQRHLFDKKLDAVAMFSRCLCFELDVSIETLCAYSQYVQDVARAECLDGKPIEDYVDLVVDRCQGNVRQALQAVASGEMLL